MNKTLQEFMDALTNCDLVTVSLTGCGKKEWTTKEIYDAIWDDITKNAPYSAKDYFSAKEQGLDLDDWNDYVKFYGLGEREAEE